MSKNQKSKVLFFTAIWCSSCRSMKPLMESLKEEMSEYADIETIDVEEDYGVDLSLEYTIRNVPTILIMKGNEVKERLSGTQSREKLRQTILKYK